MVKKIDTSELIRELGDLGVDHKTAVKFLVWHQRHPLVWKYFEAFTLKAIEVGKRIGAKAVTERVRWEVEIERQEESFKVNNNYPAYYARMFMVKHAEKSPHRDFFSTRELKGLSK